MQHEEQQQDGEVMIEDGDQATVLYSREFLVSLKRRCKVLKARREQAYGQVESLGQIYNLVIEAGLVAYEADVERALAGGNEDQDEAGEPQP